MDERNGWIVSGQMSGTVNAWKLPSHIATASLVSTDDIDIQSSPKQPDVSRIDRSRSTVTGVNIVKYGTFQCRTLMSFGDGAVRYIIIDYHSNKFCIYLLFITQSPYISFIYLLYVLSRPWFHSYHKYHES